MKPQSVRSGWVFIHLDGRVELDYFYTEIWMDKGERVSRQVWKKRYRPDCEMRESILVVVE